MRCCCFPIFRHYSVDSNAARWHQYTGDGAVSVTTCTACVGNTAAPACHHVHVVITAVVARYLQVTNPRWSAPEVLRNNVASLSADVFSFAIVMWEILTWSQPYEDMMSVQVGVGIQLQLQ